MCEVKHNAKVRQNEHNNSTRSLYPPKHLRNNINDCFRTTAFLNASKTATTRKNLEESYTALWEPDLKEQRLLKTSFI